MGWEIVFHNCSMIFTPRSIEVVLNEAFVIERLVLNVIIVQYIYLVTNVLITYVTLMYST